jgi:hypothetical protein
VEKVVIRELQFSDAFSLIRIIKKMNIKEEVKGIFADASGMTKEQIDELSNEKGIHFVMMLVENLDRAEQEIYEFIASLSGIPKDQIAALQLEETFEILMQLTQLKGLKSFLQSVGKLMNMKS